MILNWDYRAANPILAGRTLGSLSGVLFTARYAASSPYTRPRLRLSAHPDLILNDVVVTLTR